MNLHGINRRLDKLDALHPVATPPCFIHLIVEADEGETKDQAIARWCAENPDDAPPGQPDDSGDRPILRFMAISISTSRAQPELEFTVEDPGVFTTP